MNSSYNKIRGENCTLFVHKNFRNSIFEQALLDNEEKLGECYRLTTIQSSKFARVYKLTVRFDNEDKGIYFKQYLCRSVRDFIKNFVRANRALRAFKAAEMLGDDGFDAPTIIAIGESRYGLFHTTNFMVTLEIEDAKQIYQLICDLQNGSELETKNRRGLIRAFGRTVGKMHAKGIFHGDLRLGNILARLEKDQWRFFFLDNERTRKFRYLPMRLRLKNLVQINMLPSNAMSNTDRMRFFKEYQAQNEESNVRKTMLVEKVLKKTSKRLRKKMKASR